MSYFEDMEEAWEADDYRRPIDDYADPDVMNEAFLAAAARETKRQMKLTAEWYSKISGQVPFDSGDRERFAREFAVKHD